MPQYMLLIGKDRQDEGKPMSVSDQVLMQMYQEWTDKMAKAGIICSAHKLKDEEGYRVRARTDGPYAESKELIGGYYIIETKDYAAAREWAKGCPSIHHEHAYVDVVEVEF